MNRLLIRHGWNEEKDKLLEKDTEAYRISVISACRGAGGTFIALALAQLMSERNGKTANKVTLLEMRKMEEGCRAIYDAIGIEKRFAGRLFHDFYGMAARGEPFRSWINLDEGINWMLPLSVSQAPVGSGRSSAVTEDTNSSYRMYSRLLLGGHGDTLVCDLSPSWETWELLSDMDVLIIVVDPSPSGLLAAEERLRYFRKGEAAGRKVIWVINRWNGGIEKKETFYYLQVKDPILIPDISYEHICRAEFGCMLPLHNTEIRKALQKPMEKIIQMIFS